MFPLDTEHATKRIVEGGIEKEVEEFKLIRYRRCLLCGWRQTTFEIPVGQGHQGDIPSPISIGTDEICECSKTVDNRPTLPFGDD